MNLGQSQDIHKEVTGQDNNREYPEEVLHESEEARADEQVDSTLSDQDVALVCVDGAHDAQKYSWFSVPSVFSSAAELLTYVCHQPVMLHGC